MKKPNILLIMNDQHRASATGYNGKEKVITPNYNKFAAESTNFRNAIANSPVCGPSRACLITGLHSLSHGLVTNDLNIKTGIKTLPQCLNDAGYKCSYIGKWHMDGADRGAYIPPGERRQGFDDYWAVYNCNHRYYDGYFYQNDNPEPVWIDGYEPFKLTELGIDFLRKKSNSDEPYFLTLSYGPPHCPYRLVDKKYLEMYPADSIEFLLNVPSIQDEEMLKGYHEFNELKKNITHHGDLRKEFIAGYYANITALDECFGKLMKVLEETGQNENTIVIFTSDHGDMLFSQNHGWKNKPWIESVNVPMLMRWPGNIPAGVNNNGLLSIVDLMPTLLSLIGGNIPETIEGIDLSSLVLGKTNKSPESIFINCLVTMTKSSYTEWRGIKTKEYTYARFKDRPWVMYNDVKDPYQMINLAGNSAYTDIQNYLESELKGWMDRLNDNFDTSADIMKKYYAGITKENVVPFYENDLIKTEKIARSKKRLETNPVKSQNPG